MLCYLKGIYISRPSVQIYISRSPAIICILRPLPNMYLVASAHNLHLSVGFQPSICIHRPCLIRTENNSSLRLHIMLLFLSLLSNFVVMTIRVVGIVMALLSVAVVRISGCCLLSIYYLQSWWLSTCFRKSHQRCSIKNAVLKHSAIFTGKQLYWSLFLRKSQA